MRLPPRLPADVRARVTLYGKFFSQAYDQYANRQAVLELKAQTLDNLPVGVARLDDEGVILEANPKLHDFLQMSAASSGVHLLDRLAERWGFPLCEEWRGMIEQGERQVASTVFCPPPEGGEPGRCYYLALHRLAGHDVQHLFILEDVTDVSQLDMQALQRRDFLERLVGSMRDLVLVMGPSGRIRYASREDRALMGKNLFSISRPISDKDITWAPETLPDLDHPIEIYIDLGVKRPVPMELAISAMSGPTASGVESYLAVGRDLTRIRTLERRIRRLAVFDPLTDLYNRGQCFAILSNESNRARRLGTSLAVLFFELDDFENAVATYGFKHGDDLCIALADVMRQNSREGMDYACRVAEEQFALIVTQIPLDKLSPIAGRFLESYTKATAEGGEPGMTLSCGIAVWQADEDAEETLHRARIAARKASQSGGNKVVLGQRPD
jgi:diguanylate cyclase (GGDEF)-like protein